jgi:hypothetical protein
MNRKTYLVAAIAAFASAASFAEVGEANPAGQYAEPIQAATTRDAVRADLAAFKKAGVNPWSTSYNQLNGFRSTTDRDEVRAGFVAERDRVTAMTAEDSGSRYLTQRPARAPVADTLAGSFNAAQ